MTVCLMCLLVQWISLLHGIQFLDSLVYREILDAVATLWGGRHKSKSLDDWKLLPSAVIISQ